VLDQTQIKNQNSGSWVGASLELLAANTEGQVEGACIGGTKRSEPPTQNVFSIGKQEKVESLNVPLGTTRQQVDVNSRPGSISMSECHG